MGVPALTVVLSFQLVTGHPRALEDVGARPSSPDFQDHLGSILCPTERSRRGVMTTLSDNVVTRYRV